MELSSEVGRAHEVDNLDIDIELGDSTSHVGTDDLMHDEDTQDLLVHADDSEMVDDYEYQETDQEGMMQYDPQEPQDEQLYDVGLDAEGDTELVEGFIDSYDNPSVHEQGEVDINIDDGTIAAQSVPEYTKLAVTVPEQIDDIDVDDVGQIEATASAKNVNHALDASIPRSAIEPSFEIEHAGQIVVQEMQQPEEHVLEGEHGLLQSQVQPVSNEHDIQEIAEATQATVTAVDEPASQIKDIDSSLSKISMPKHEDTHVNEEQSAVTTAIDSLQPPVIVCFRDSELYLFSTSDQDPAACLLEDVTLLHSSLQNLLQQCRTVLNEHIELSDTLEMDIAELGLVLNESSSDATVFTLADIVDIFVQLSQNDGADMSTPLYITLSTRPTFNARMEELGAAVAQGKGLSQLNPEAQIFEEYEPEEHVAEAEAEEEQAIDQHDELERQQSSETGLPINNNDSTAEEPEVDEPRVVDEQTEKEPALNEEAPSAIEGDLDSVEPTLGVESTEASEEPPLREDLLDLEDEDDEERSQDKALIEQDATAVLDQHQDYDQAETALTTAEEAADPELDTSAHQEQNSTELNGETLETDLGNDANPLNAQHTNSDEDYDDLDEDNEHTVTIQAHIDENVDTLDETTTDVATDESASDVVNGTRKPSITTPPVLTRKRSKTEMEEPEEAPAKKQQVV